MANVLRRLSVVVQRSGRLSRIYWLAKYLWKDPYNVGETARGRYLDVLSVIPAEALANVLELGCGEGVFTALLADRAGCVTATDISLTAIRRARRRLQGRDHVLCCVEDVSNGILRQDAYSLVICLELLYYLPQDRLDECMAKIIRAVTHGGYVLLGHRRERPQYSGWYTIPFAAETIHRRFRELGSVVCVHEVVRPGYLLSLFKRIEQPSRAGSEIDIRQS